MIPRASVTGTAAAERFMATTKQKLGWGLGAVLVLAMFGSCINDDGPSTNSIAAPTTSTQTSPTTTSAVPIPVRKRVEWEGTVLDYDAAGSGAGLFIDIDGERTRVDIDHVGAVTCGGYAASDSNRAVMQQRLTELAPIGTAVRVVRSMPLTPGGYVYIAGSADTTITASATEPTTTAGSTTASASTTTTTTEKAPVSGTTTVATSTTNTSTDTEILLNERFSPKVWAPWTCRASTCPSCPRHHSINSSRQPANPTTQPRIPYGGRCCSPRTRTRGTTASDCKPNAGRTTMLRSSKPNRKTNSTDYEPAQTGSSTPATTIARHTNSTTTETSTSTPPPTPTAAAEAEAVAVAVGSAVVAAGADKHHQ